MWSLLRAVMRHGRRPRRSSVTCYLRENGPIGYQLAIFGESPRGAAVALMESSLSWAWKGRARDWTELTVISLSALLADLPGGALIVGLDGEVPTQVTDVIVKAWLRRFCRAEPGPLATAVSVTPGRQVVFVQQHATEPVSRLLDALHVDRHAAVRSTYARLGSSSLESIAARL